MAKSESSRGEAVEDGRIDLWVVSCIVSLGQRQDVQLLHEVSAKDDGQPLVVGDVLEEIQVGLNLILSVKQHTCISAMRILRASW